MRSLNSKTALAFGLAAIAASGASGEVGCSAKKPTEIVPGALTQVQVPRDLTAIKITVDANGKQAFCGGYVVGPGGTVELPSTLGVVSGQSNTTLTISIRGYDDPNSQDLNNCDGQLGLDSDGGGGPGPRVLRQAVLTYVDQETLFLPMPLSFSCYDVDCADGGVDPNGMTCAAGQCATNAVASSSLAAFTPTLVDGTQDCFSPSTCFNPAAAATVVDPVQCLYALPAGTPATIGGINVRVTYTDVKWEQDPATNLFVASPGSPLEQEILSQDVNEGFIIPDPSTPNQFKLAPGLCNLAHNFTTTPSNVAKLTRAKTYHSISNVDVGVNCPAKGPLLPFCAGEQNGNVSTATPPPVIACGVATPLEPTPSAVYLIMDDSGSMYGAYGDGGAATALNGAFASPLFKHTYVAFRFLTHSGAECTSNTTAYGSPGGDAGLAFGLAPNVQPQVAQFLLNWQAPDSRTAPAALDLQAAMREDQGAYQYLTQFRQRLGGDGGAGGPLNQAAAIFFVNRTPVSGAAPGGDAGADDSGVPAGDYPTTAADCTPLLGAGQTTVSGALSGEAETAAKAGLSTYFMVLGAKPPINPQPQVDFYNGVAEAGATGATVLNATDPNNLAAVEGKLASLATCVYDVPAGVTTGATLSYSVPPNNAVNPSSIALPQSLSQKNTCTAATAGSGDGWNIVDGHILICGTSCSTLQQIVVGVAAPAPVGDGGTDAGAPAATDAGAAATPSITVTATVPCVDGGS